MVGIDRDRLVDAGVFMVSRFGAKALSLTSVARHAGVGRATAYRLFGGRDELISAVVRREVEVLSEKITQWMAPTELSPSEKVSILVVKVLAYIGDHEALQYVLANEPEEIIGTIIATGPNRVQASTLIDVIVERTLPGLLAVPEVAERCVPSPQGAAEFIVRAVHSYLLIPKSSLSALELGELVARAVIKNP